MEARKTPARAPEGPRWRRGALWGRGAPVWVRWATRFRNATRHPSVEASVSGLSRGGCIGTRGHLVTAGTRGASSEQDRPPRHCSDGLPTAAITPGAHGHTQTESSCRTEG